MKAIVNDELVELTPEILAKLFAEMNAHEQARFFNHVDEVASQWELGCSLIMQMQYITDNDGLTDAGRRVMQYIGEYSHWGVK